MLYFKIPFVLAAISLSVHLSADSTRNDCEVPICDITAKIEEFKVGGKSFREGEGYRFVEKLRSTYKKSISLEVWQNLFEFSVELYALNTMESDEQWVRSGTLNLKDDALQGLMKFSSPVQAASLSRYYSDLSNETQRFIALQHWVTQIPMIENLKEIYALADFAGKAAEISQSLEDSGWVIEASKRVKDVATSRILELDPHYEGIYELFITETSGNPDPSCQTPKLDRLSIINTRSYGGLSAVFFNSKNMSRTVIPSVLIEDAGRDIKGQLHSYGRPTIFQIRIDTDTGKFRGRLTHVKTACNFEIHGVRLKSSGELFKDGPLAQTPSLKEVVGIYEGGSRNVRGRLIIKEFPGPLGQQISASFFDSVSGIEFNMGYYIQNRALLIIQQPWVDEGIVRWHLALRQDESGSYYWTGFGFSTKNGQIYELKFEKKQSIVPFVEYKHEANYENIHTFSK